jgi:hypothetical protein
MSSLTVLMGCGSKDSATVSLSSGDASMSFSVAPSGLHLIMSPSGVQSVVAGTSPSFTLTSESGYVLSSTVGGNCPAGAWIGNEYTLGNITENCTVEFSTTPSAVYMYQTDNIYYGQNVGDRATTTATCEADRSAYGGGAVCTHYVALLGYSSDNGIQDIHENYGVPMEGEVKTLDEIHIADTLQGMIDTKPELIAGSFGNPDSSVWSGFGAGGLSSGNNCTDWSGPTFGGTLTVFLNSLNQGWSDTTVSCTMSFQRRYTCLCW